MYRMISTYKKYLHKTTKNLHTVVRREALFFLSEEVGESFKYIRAGKCPRLSASLALYFFPK